MTGAPSAPGPRIRYQPDEQPPTALAIGLGLQLAAIVVTVPVLLPTIVMRAGGATDAHVSWAVFAAVVLCGTGTVLQAVRYGRIGSGHSLAMCSAAAFVWPCIAALDKGGTGLLATLVIVSALVQLLVSARLAAFRRLLTPTISGTVLMLVPFTAMPIVFEMLDDVPPGSPAHAAPLSAGIAVLVIIGTTLRAKGSLTLWAPLLGMAAGSAVAYWFDLYDTNRVVQAPWAGLPEVSWPQPNLDFGPAFWSLLPAFILVTLIVTLRSISSCVAVQQASWRQRRAVDFRAVQGTLNVDGLSNLLGGLAGTVPNTSLSLTVPLINLTGVAARSVGVAAGMAMVLFAVFPKALAALLAIPGPVVAAYLMVLMAMLFLVGVRVLLEGGLDERKALIAGVSFWIGIGFQQNLVFPQLVSGFAGGLLNNAVTSGGLAAIAMTLFLDVAQPRPARLLSRLDLSALPGINEFLRLFASRCGWDREMEVRLESAADATLAGLLELDGHRSRTACRLRLKARRTDAGAVLEFAISPRKRNLEDQIATLVTQSEGGTDEQEASMRKLHHLASSVRHHQFHDVDIVTVQIDARSSATPP